MRDVPWEMEGRSPPLNLTFTQLWRLEREGKLSFYEQCELQSVEWKGDAWKVTCNHPSSHDWGSASK
jgi:hypothetical protein